MPLYEYVCEKCEIVCQDVHPMADPHPPCPQCGASYGEVWHQHWQASEQNVVGEPSTFGQIAAKNAKRAGKEQMDLMRDEVYGPKVPLPWFRSGKVGNLRRMDKPLDLSTVKDVDRYVTTGRKD